MSGTTISPSADDNYAPYNDSSFIITCDADTANWTQVDDVVCNTVPDFCPSSIAAYIETDGIESSIDVECLERVSGYVFFVFDR